MRSFQEHDAPFERDADFVCDARLRRVSGTHRITASKVSDITFAKQMHHLSPNNLVIPTIRFFQSKNPVDFVDRILLLLSRTK